MYEDVWDKWEAATDRLDVATQAVEGSLCGPDGVQRKAWSRYVTLRRTWERWRRKCEKTLRNFQILSFSD